MRPQRRQNMKIKIVQVRGGRGGICKLQTESGEIIYSIGTPGGRSKASRKLLGVAESFMANLREESSMAAHVWKQYR